MVIACSLLALTFVGAFFHSLATDVTLGNRTTLVAGDESVSPRASSAASCGTAASAYLLQTRRSRELLKHAATESLPDTKGCVPDMISPSSCECGTVTEQKGTCPVTACIFPCVKVEVPDDLAHELRNISNLFRTVMPPEASKAAVHRPAAEELPTAWQQVQQQASELRALRQLPELRSLQQLPSAPSVFSREADPHPSELGSSQQLLAAPPDFFQGPQPESITPPSHLQDDTLVRSLLQFGITARTGFEIMLGMAQPQEQIEEDPAPVFDWSLEVPLVLASIIACALMALASLTCARSTYLCLRASRLVVFGPANVDDAEEVLMGKEEQHEAWVLDPEIAGSLTYNDTTISTFVKANPPRRPPEPDREATDAQTVASAVVPSAPRAEASSM